MAHDNNQTSKSKLMHVKYVVKSIKLYNILKFQLWFNYYHDFKSPGMEPVVWSYTTPDKEILNISNPPPSCPCLNRAGPCWAPRTRDAMEWQWARNARHARLRCNGQYWQWVGRSKDTPQGKLAGRSIDRKTALNIAITWTTVTVRLLLHYIPSPWDWLCVCLFRGRSHEFNSEEVTPGRRDIME